MSKLSKLYYYYSKKGVKTLKINGKRYNIKNIAIGFLTSSNNISYRVDYDTHGVLSLFEIKTYIDHTRSIRKIDAIKRLGA